ncbi:MAG: hypothetical protein IJ598_12670 [Ruminococcus sp.]|nr:hypothetical protein [Ruminococcus sp.]
MRRKLSILFTVLLAVLCTGCDHARQIETAAIIENVTVDRRGEELVYTFYRLTSDEKPWGTEVPAASFEEACRLANERYIPHLSLAMLELLMLSEDVYTEVMRGDVDYISTQPSFSPIAYVTLCDEGAMKQFRQANRVQRLMEEQIILLKKNNPAVNINYLSVCNSLAHGNEKFLVPFLSSEKELKVNDFEIDPAKLK